MLYGLAPEALASCSASVSSDPAQRCIYPDTLDGTWNVSLTYASDTVITLPHFLGVRSHSLTCLHAQLQLTLNVRVVCLSRLMQNGIWCSKVCYHACGVM